MPPARKWGPGTAAIVRLLVASDGPLTQVAIADVVGVTQPRASQVLKQLSGAKAVSISGTGYTGKRARLLDLYARQARTRLAVPESYWYSTRPLVEQARRIAKDARREGVRVAFSADVGPDLLVPWRHPTLAVVYADAAVGLETTGFVPAEGRGDASVVVRWTSDATLLSVGACWPATVEGIPLADPVQQWFDLIDLGGEDRMEAADRLRQAIVNKTIALAA